MVRLDTRDKRVLGQMLDTLDTLASIPPPYSAEMARLSSTD